MKYIGFDEVHYEDIMEIGVQSGPTSARKWDPPGVGLATRGDVVVSVPKCGSGSGLFARLLLLFHRLSEAIAFTIHLEDVAMVSQTVQ